MLIRFFWQQGMSSLTGSWRTYTTEQDWEYKHQYSMTSKHGRKKHTEMTFLIEVVQPILSIILEFKHTHLLISYLSILSGCPVHDAVKKPKLNNIHMIQETQKLPTQDITVKK